MTEDLGTQVCLISFAGPEYKSMKSCLYVGMASEDMDVAELVETIAATAREIEENSRVRSTHQCSFLFQVLSHQTAGVTRKGAALGMSVHSLLKSVNISCKLGLVPGVRDAKWV